MATISVSGIQKTYPNGFFAVRGIDLDITDGEFVVVVGPSGCGKSTFLRLVAGLEEATGGIIRIGARDVTNLEPADRDIAMVFQNYALYPHMSVYNNMAYGLRNRGMAKDEIEKRVQEAARILVLEKLLDRKPRMLSGGQRQRVAMGRAIVREPAAFLFDEPLSNLDAKLRVQMRGEIKRLQRRLGTTSLYVTHDQAEAMTMADRLVVMNEGRVEQVGTPLDLYRRPATSFVGGFIGSPAMNFIKGRVSQWKIELGDQVRLPVPVGNLAAAEGKEILVGLRPEHMTVNGTPSVASFKVDLVEPLGAETLVHGIFAGEPIALRIEGTTSLVPGQTVSFSIDPANIHLFDAATGQRVN